MTARAADFGLTFGTLPSGPLNAVTDVAGVRVGHVTLSEGDLRTGFTALIPAPGDLFQDKLPAAVEVINGFGKSAGLMQVAELGQLETPILFTNTLAVSAGFDALVTRALAGNADIGRETGTVNPVVLECNDGYLSDIRARALTPDDALTALAVAADGPVVEGAIGAGTGMSAFGFKGGIGTASRLMRLGGRDYVLGALVLANFGRAGDLVLPDGRRPMPPKRLPDMPERGSVVIALVTDLPMETRQLKRVARRAGAGLARLGAFWGNGSGDIALAVSTATRIRHHETGDIVMTAMLNENRIDIAFRAAADATAEAVINAMLAAPTMVGRDGHWRAGLADVLSQA